MRGDRTLGTTDDGRPRFFADQSSFVLGPGARRHVTVAFQSAQAGMFAEGWRLVTTPTTPGLELGFSGVAESFNALAGAKLALQVGICKSVGDNVLL